MRARDARAIAFCLATSLLVLAVSYAVFHNVWISLALFAGFIAVVMTRPRMRRVMRRLRSTGRPDFSNYFEN